MYQQSKDIYAYLYLYLRKRDEIITYWIHQQVGSYSIHQNAPIQSRNVARRGR